MTTYSVKTADAQTNWVLIDAEGVVVGRLASYIALRLRGKHRADFTPHVDQGDHVVVINADKVVMTGRKMTNKIYHRHTGHPGGIKTTTPQKIMDGKFPERVIEKAVERMMPRESPLARKQYSKLRVYRRRRASARGAEPGNRRLQVDELQRTREPPDARSRGQPGRSSRPSAAKLPPSLPPFSASRRSTSRAAPTRPASARTPPPACG